MGLAVAYSGWPLWPYAIPWPSHKEFLASYRYYRQMESYCELMLGPRGDLWRTTPSGGIHFKYHTDAVAIALGMEPPPCSAIGQGGV